MSTIFEEDEDREAAEELSRATELLKRLFPEGSTVYTVIRHVSRSKMSRTVGAVSIAQHQEFVGSLSILHPNSAVSLLTDYRLDPDRNGVIVKGIGFDVGARLTQAISLALYQNAFVLKSRWL